MTLAEWLIKVEKEALTIVSPIIKEINGGYIKIIQEKEKSVTIAIGEDPQKITLPKEIKRTRIKQDHSCWERWEVRKEKKNVRKNI